jgi:hypothetical protein
MTFTKLQQRAHREVFIEKCRQKAWDAACTADHIAKQFDKLMADYEKLKKEDGEHEAAIKALDNGKNERRYRRRNVLAKQMEFIQQSAAELQRALQQLYANVEQNLALATYAETWEWKEMDQRAELT